ncbi:hypothetical protein HBB16_17645 [Pseudonocardia sp. MCCB 268]|nr:hypothetical protein [Pseudonocardia cytotoxica]
MEKLPNDRLVEVLQARDRQLAHEHAALRRAGGDQPRGPRWPTCPTALAARARGRLRSEDQFEWAAGDRGRADLTRPGAEREPGSPPICASGLPGVHRARGGSDRPRLSARAGRSPRPGHRGLHRRAGPEAVRPVPAPLAPGGPPPSCATGSLPGPVASSGTRPCGGAATKAPCRLMGLRSTYSAHRHRHPDRHRVARRRGCRRGRLPDRSWPRRLPAG